jgi:hypothetical protein
VIGARGSGVQSRTCRCGWWCRGGRRGRGRGRGSGTAWPARPPIRSCGPGRPAPQLRPARRPGTASPGALWPPGPGPPTMSPRPGRPPARAAAPGRQSWPAHQDRPGVRQPGLVQIIVSGRAHPRATGLGPLPGRHQVQHAEFAAGMAQQVRQVVQALDVFEPERLPGEGDRPVFALTPAHRPRGGASRGRGARHRRLRWFWVAVPAGAGEVGPGPLREGRHPRPAGRAQRGRQQLDGPPPITGQIAGAFLRPSSRVCSGLRLCGG